MIAPLRPPPLPPTFRPSQVFHRASRHIAGSPAEYDSPVLRNPRGGGG